MARNPAPPPSFPLPLSPSPPPPSTIRGAAPPRTPRRRRAGIAPAVPFARRRRSRLRLIGRRRRGARDVYRRHGAFDGRWFGFDDSERQARGSRRLRAPAAFTAAAFSRCMAKKWCVFFPAACAASRAFCSRISALSASRAEAAAAAAAASAFSAARRLRSSGFMKNGLGAAGFEGAPRFRAWDSNREIPRRPPGTPRSTNHRRGRCPGPGTSRDSTRCIRRRAGPRRRRRRTRDTRRPARETRRRAAATPAPAPLLSPPQPPPLFLSPPPPRRSPPSPLFLSPPPPQQPLVSSRREGADAPSSPPRRTPRKAGRMSPLSATPRPRRRSPAPRGARRRAYPQPHHPPRPRLGLGVGVGVRALAWFGGVIRDSRRGPSHSFLLLRLGRGDGRRDGRRLLRLCGCESLRLGHLDRSRAAPSRFRRVRLAGRRVRRRRVRVGVGNRRGIARGVRGLGARAGAEEGGDARSRRNVGLARLGGFGLPRGDGGDRRRAFAEDVREGFRSRLVRRGGRRNGRRRGAPRLVLQRGRHVRASRAIAVVHRLGPRLGEGQIGRAGVVIVDGAHIVEPRSCGTEIRVHPLGARLHLHRDRRRRDGLFHRPATLPARRDQPPAPRPRPVACRRRRAPFLCALVARIFEFDEVVGTHILVSFSAVPRRGSSRLTRERIGTYCSSGRRRLSRLRRRVCRTVLRTTTPGRPRASRRSMAALAATRLSLLAPSVPAMSSRASDKNRAKRLAARPPLRAPPPRRTARRRTSPAVAFRTRASSSPAPTAASASSSPSSSSRRAPAIASSPPAATPKAQTIS